MHHRPTDTSGQGSNDLLPDQELAGGLPRFCFEPDLAESRRVLAWLNSICFVYVVIGLLGLKVPALVIQRKAPVQEEGVPTVIEPSIPAVQAVNADAALPEAPSRRPSEEGGPVVSVTEDSPAVEFPVSTVGNRLVPLGMAPAPPAHPMQGAVVQPTARTEQIAATGVRGSRPRPTYPNESWLNREQGEVVLRLEVDESGKVCFVTIKQSSGYARLDKAAAEHVRRYWFFEAAQSKRIYECAIIFKLQ